jgi:homoserine kinase
MIEISIPATSANLGPGFDCLGIALSLRNVFTVEETESGLELQGCEPEYSTPDNLLYKSLKSCADRLGYKLKGLRIGFENNIPVSRGLGSSSTCVLGGIIAANELAGKPLSTDEILKRAADIEGLPDNVAPALLGSMVAAVIEYDKVFYSRIELPASLKIAAFVPGFPLLTSKARAVLPESIPMRDSVFNTGRSALMVAALSTGNLSLLPVACQDRLHQQYRAPLIDGFYEVVGEARRLGCLAVFLSGAGPTILSFYDEAMKGFIEGMSDFLSGLPGAWRTMALAFDPQGAIVKER